MKTEVNIVPTGTANIASVRSAFERLGVRTRITESRDDLRDAQFVVVPGVGALAPAVERLETLGLREPLQARVAEGRPTLAICLGMQLLCRASEESPGIAGLGCLPQTAERFPSGLRIPHLGWNTVEPADSMFIEEGDAYFAHSYRLTEIPPGWKGATTQYGERFVSALERGSVLACQFHPELSGAWGSRLLRRWMEQGGEAASC